MPEFGVVEVGKEREVGDLVLLRVGLAEKDGLRAGQVAIVQRLLRNWCSIKLKRQADGHELSGNFKKEDLATAVPPGGELLHLAVFLGRPAAVVGAVLAADLSAGGVADGLGRLPLELAILGGRCIKEAWEVMWAGTVEGVRLGWAAQHLVVEDVSDQAAVARTMGNSLAALALFRSLLDSSTYERTCELVAALPAAAAAVAAAETAADVVALLAAAPHGVRAQPLPEGFCRSYEVGVDRKEGDRVVVRYGLAEAEGGSGNTLSAGEVAVVTWFRGYRGSEVKLTRESDQRDLGYDFKANDLATAKGGGQLLLHVAAASGAFLNQ